MTSLCSNPEMYVKEIQMRIIIQYPTYKVNRRKEGRGNGSHLMASAKTVWRKLLLPSASFSVADDDQWLNCKLMIGYEGSQATRLLWVCIC